MKRLSILISVFLASTLLTTFPAVAQHGQHHEQGMMARSDSMPGAMMQGDMMQMMNEMHQKMMQNPMHRASMMSFMLPALADTLGLSDQQEDRIEQLRSESMTRLQEHREQMMTQRQEFMNLFEADQNPSPDAVRRHLGMMTGMWTDQQVSMYDDSQKMREVLTDEQRRTLAGLTHQQTMHQMMTKVSMMDMMQMMRTMHRQMMGPGMSMMQDDMMQNMPRQNNRQNR